MILRPHGTIVLLSRLLGVSVILIGLFGCATKETPRPTSAPFTSKHESPDPPAKAAFRDGSVTVSFAGDKEKALVFLRRFFFNKSVSLTPVSIDEFDSRLEFITFFMLADSPKDAPRLKRFAYKFQIDSKPLEKKCSEISIAWTIESKGIRESTWSVQPDDLGYIPPQFSELRKQLEGHQCK
jgi:hypothetical protein